MIDGEESERRTHPTLPSLEMRQATPDLESQIRDFFDELSESGIADVFSPHPFTDQHSHIIANYQGDDFYSFAICDGSIAGYGLLRGWDEGYAIPSLGIAVSPFQRGAGLGLSIMYYLHAVAALRGAEKVRLRVNDTNTAARRLYEKVGYVFEDRDETHLIGFVHVGRSSSKVPVRHAQG